MTAGIISGSNRFSRSERSHTASKLGFPSNGWFKSPSLISAEAEGSRTLIHPPRSETRSALCGNVSLICESDNRCSASLSSWSILKTSALRSFGAWLTNVHVSLTINRSAQPVQTFSTLFYSAIELLQSPSNSGTCKCPNTHTQLGFQKICIALWRKTDHGEV